MNDNVSSTMRSTMYFVFHKVVLLGKFNGMVFSPVGGELEPYYQDFYFVIDCEPSNHGQVYDFTYRNGIIISFIGV